MDERCPVSLKLLIVIENDYVDLAIKILRENHRKSVFLEAAGALRVTAVQLASWRGRLNLLELLYEKGADINISDKLGRTALYYAIHHSNVEIVKWLLEHGANVNSKVGINSWPKDMPYATNMTMEPDCPIGRNLPLPECWGRTPLHQAVRANEPEIVRMLVNAGAMVDAQDEQGVTPLLLAGANLDCSNKEEMMKFDEVVEILASANASVNVVHPDTGTTVLHHASMLGSKTAIKRLLEAGAWPLFQCIGTGSTALHIAAGEGHLETLQVLLEAVDPVCVNIRDEVGRTPLHKAAYQDHQECVRMLVDYGGNLAAETKTGVTVIDAMLAHVRAPLPLLTEVLDSCVRTSCGSATEKGRNITVDFHVLAPVGNLQMSVVCALIASISEIEQLTILQHPLVEAFLSLKWSKLRVFFFLFVLVYMCFVLLLSGYGMILIEMNIKYSVPTGLLMVCSCFLLGHNAVQVLMAPKHYLRQFETWISATCAIIALIISTTRIDAHESNQDASNRIESGEERKDIAEPWVLHSVSLAILLAWMQMMLFIGRFPTWGYYALMFSTVLKNVLKVLLAFICLIFGFALSFAVLFHENDQFDDLWKAVVKTVVMMMGEYEYGDLFASDQEKKSLLPITGRIVFVLFIMLASIVLMNLMIGLAVSDIQGLQKEGHIRRLLKQAEFVAHLERITSHPLFRNKWVHRKLQAFLDSRQSIPTRIELPADGTYNRNTHEIHNDLVEALFTLASNNQSVAESVAKTDGSVSRILMNIEDQLHELRKQIHPNVASRRISRLLVNRRVSKHTRSVIV
ncbi:transient receptor potential channel pyrexia [Cephus cinctus]|uniref:Transient receptor potential channel pyrexia n=1 Tax=Cephus cinctus TaxID=211228 RepID=A0AAJ7FLR0_CEPCN|nr:transient receptor potential channel pyrexia [Cephus cinctus]